MRTYGGNGDYLYALAVGQDGKLFVDGGEEGVARVYKIESSQVLSALAVPGEIQVKGKK